MAMSKLKQIERMVKIEKPKTENTKTFKSTIDKSIEGYRDVLKVTNLAIGYDKVLSKMSFNVYRKDKLGVINS